MASDKAVELASRIEVLDPISPHFTGNVAATADDFARQHGHADFADMVAKAEIAKKLPKYADTGQPFVPGVDPCFVIDREVPSWNLKAYGDAPVYSKVYQAWRCRTTEDEWATVFFSAEAAALARGREVNGG